MYNYSYFVYYNLSDARDSVKHLSHYLNYDKQATSKRERKALSH